METLTKATIAVHWNLNKNINVITICKRENSDSFWSKGYNFLWCFIMSKMDHMEVVAVAVVKVWIKMLVCMPGFIIIIILQYSQQNAVINIYIVAEYLKIT